MIRQLATGRPCAPARVPARPAGETARLFGRATVRGAALVACLTAGTCTWSPTSPQPHAAPAPAALVIAAGDGQSGVLGSALETAPAVLVTDAAGGGIAGITVRFTVVAGGGSVETPTAVTDADGRASPGSWTLGDEPGTQRLRAEAPGLGAVEFTATAESPSPATLSVVRGDGQTAAAGTPVPVRPAVVVRDEDSRPVEGVAVSFVALAGGGSVGAPSILTDQAGVAEVDWTLGAAPGPNELRASVAELAPVTFSAMATAGGGGGGGGSEAGGSGFDIEVRYHAGSSPSAAQAAAFSAAAERWQRVIIGDLADVALSRPAGTCTSPDPIEETIDDLVIFVTLESIDGPGGVLGSAGPCIVRSGTLLPIVGRMRFDTADLSNLEVSGLLDEVVVHEMGHVIGIGTLWDALGFVADPAAAGGTDPHFTGSGAVSAFDAIGGAGYTGARVPVEATGGPGTRDAHWRESVFDREIMTGWLDVGANPLSLVTIRSLADMAYSVDEGEAESVSLTISSSFVPRAGRGPDGLALGPDLLLIPLEVVSTSGRRVGIIPR